VSGEMFLLSVSQHLPIIYFRSFKFYLQYLPANNLLISGRNSCYWRHEKHYSSYNNIFITFLSCDYTAFLSNFSFKNS